MVTKRNSNMFGKLMLAGVVLALSGTASVGAPSIVAPLDFAGARNVLTVAAKEPAYLRATDFLGESVRNGKGEIVGSVDDLILSKSDNVMYAVLSVGGFLGVGDKLVAVPFEKISVGVLKVEGLLMYDVSKEELKKRPEFSYDFQTDEEARSQFVDAARWRFEKWESKIERRSEELKKDTSKMSKEAAAKLDQAWTNTKQTWAEMKDASKDAWDASKRNFNEAMSDLEAAWKDATS